MRKPVVVVVVFDMRAHMRLGVVQYPYHQYTSFSGITVLTGSHRHHQCRSQLTGTANPRISGRKHAGRTGWRVDRAECILPSLAQRRDSVREWCAIGAPGVHCPGGWAGRQGQLEEQWSLIRNGGNRETHSPNIAFALRHTASTSASSGISRSTARRSAIRRTLAGSLRFPRKGCGAR